MSDTTLWSLAIGVGAVGLLLLAVAGVAAWLLSGRAHGMSAAPQQRTSYGERVGPTEKLEPQDAVPDGGPPRVRRPAAERPGGQGSGGLLLAWLKAWIFAFIHAGAVSFVLGGVTFFEDLVRANGEIQSTGTVSFPKRLLPGAFSESETSRSLTQRADEGALEDGQHGRYYARGQASTGREHAAASTAETVEWKVVDILDEAGPDGEALAGGYRPGE
jgi:hypothetical protein